MSLNTRIIIFGIGVILILVSLLPEGPNEPELSHQIYCDMVAEWDASNGEWGWPPYQGREHCPPAK